MVQPLNHVLLRRHLGLGLGHLRLQPAGIQLRNHLTTFDVIAFLGRHGVDPTHAAMFEDIAKNLVVPKARGMTTTLVTARPCRADYRQPQDRELARAADIDFVTDDLAAFLRRVNDSLEAK